MFASEPSQLIDKSAVEVGLRYYDIFFLAFNLTALPPNSTTDGVSRVPEDEGSIDV